MSENYLPFDDRTPLDAAARRNNDMFDVQNVNEQNERIDEFVRQQLAQSDGDPVSSASFGTQLAAQQVYVRRTPMEQKERARRVVKDLAVVQERIDEQTKSKFVRLLDEMRELHDKKSQDYGSDEDRLKNFHASQALGVSPFLGALVRMGDKWARITELAKKQFSTGTGPSVSDESILDTLRDMAVYSLLAIELYEEETSYEPNESTYDDQS